MTRWTSRMSRVESLHPSIAGTAMREIVVRGALLTCVVTACGCGDGVGAPVQLASTVQPISKDASGVGGRAALDAGRRLDAGRVLDSGRVLDAGRFPDGGRFLSDDVPNTRYCAPAAR
jgi:hypothetical protein